MKLLSYGPEPYASANSAIPAIIKFKDENGKISASKIQPSVCNKNYYNRNFLICQIKKYLQSGKSPTAVIRLLAK